MNVTRHVTRVKTRRRLAPRAPLERAQHFHRQHRRHAYERDDHPVLPLDYRRVEGDLHEARIREQDLQPHHDRDPEQDDPVPKRVEPEQRAPRRATVEQVEDLHRHERVDGDGPRRGARATIPGSLASKARPRPSSTAVVMLTQRICSGRIGRVAPTTIAVSRTSPWPMFVGSA